MDTARLDDGCHCAFVDASEATPECLKVSACGETHPGRMLDKPMQLKPACVKRIPLQMDARQPVEGLKPECSTKTYSFLRRGESMT
jgi:hypothetical protein